MKRLDPVSLRVFLSTLEAGTIAGAAAREHLAAAAISKRISELEQDLATWLFIRTNKGVEPTAAGLALAHLARRVLNDFDDIFEQMRHYAEGVRGLVRVCANISAITQFLPRELKAFRGRYPEVRLQLEENVSTAITRAVAENAADIGIYTGGGVPPPGLEVFDYHRDRLVIIAAADHPLADRARLAFRDTLAYDYVGLHSGSAINRLLSSRAGELNRPINWVMKVTGYDALCLMVQSGLGLGVLPERVAEPYVRLSGLCRIVLDEPWSERRLKLGVRSRAALAPASRLLLEHLLASVTAAIADDDGSLAND